MIDWGLFCLLVVVLVLIFLAFHAWRGIKSDATGIFNLEKSIEAKANMIGAEIGTARGIAEEALALAKDVKTTHYKTLLQRIDEAEQLSAANKKQIDTLLEKNLSLAARLSAIQRWSKKDAAPPEEDEEEEEIEYLPPQPQAAPTPAPFQLPGRFGQMPRKVG